MRIIHVIPIYINDDKALTFSTLGGGERYPFELAKFLTLNSPKDDVQIMLFGNSDKTFDIEGVRINMIRSFRIFSFVNRNISPLPFSTGFLKKIYWADVVHGYHIKSDTILLTCLFAKILRKYIVLTDLGGGGGFNISRILNFESLASAVLCISKFDCQFWRVKNKFVIYGGVNTEKYKYKSRKRRFVLYAGRILPHKAIEVLINSIPNNLRLVVAGRTYDLEYLNYLKSISKGKNVNFIENPDDKTLINLYRDASCFVLPSTCKDYKGKFYKKTELLGLVVIEAMSCGTPVIVSNVGPLPEIVKEGFNGFVFKDRDSKDLSKKIGRLFTSQNLIQKMGDRGRKMVEEKYNWVIISKKVRDIYGTFKMDNPIKV